MVFRKDSKVDAFQRQISALRQQLGGEPEDHGDLDLSEREGRPSSLRGLDRFRDDFADQESDRFSAPYSVQDREQRDRRSEATPAPAIPAIDMQTTIIAPTTTWHGTLDANGSLHIHGRVEGTLTARDDIFIGEEADVDASIRAARVTVAGSVRGSIHCSERFEALTRGRVAADVQAPSVVVHEGALIAGSITMAAESRVAATAAVGARAGRAGG
jgi:cytoskeletal protein CcmA (bactofilin family)